MSLTGIIFGHNLSPLLHFFAIFKYMCLTTFSDESNPLLNELQLMISEVLMFNENIDMFPSDDSYDISPGNTDPTKSIALVLVLGYLSEIKFNGEGRERGISMRHQHLISFLADHSKRSTSLTFF